MIVGSIAIYFTSACCLKEDLNTLQIKAKHVRNITILYFNDQSENSSNIALKIISKKTQWHNIR